MQIKVIIHPAEEGGYWAEVPSLKGCYSQGETVEEAKENILEAIQLYLDEDINEESLDAKAQILEVSL